MKGTYVDGFLLVVPRSKIGAYKKMAAFGKKLWMKHGALDYKECRGDDLYPKAMGFKPLSFATVTKRKGTETVWFSFIVYKSKRHRNEVNAKVMKDPAMSDMNMKDFPIPFDMKRFVYGGFKVEIGV